MGCFFYLFIIVLEIVCSYIVVWYSSCYVLVDFDRRKIGSRDFRWIEEFFFVLGVFMNYRLVVGLFCKWVCGIFISLWV